MEENNTVWRAQRTSKETDATEPIEKQEGASIIREDDELDESKNKTLIFQILQRRQAEKEELKFLC